MRTDPKFTPITGLIKAISYTNDKQIIIKQENSTNQMIPRDMRISREDKGLTAEHART